MVEAIRKVLTKFRKFEVEELLQNYFINDDDVGDDDDPFNSRTKQDMVDRFINKRPMTTNDLASLSLRLINQHSNQRVWSALQMIMPVSAQERLDHLTAQSLQEEFFDELSCYFTQVNAAASTFEHKDWIWIRLQCTGVSAATKKPEDTVYCVFVPGNPYIITTTMKASFRPYFLEAFKKVFQATELRDMHLTNKDVRALWHMTGYHRDFDRAETYMPDRPHPPPAETELQHINVMRGDRQYRLTKQARIDNDLGTRAMPQLQTLSYTLETAFRGFAPTLRRNRFSKAELNTCKHNYLQNSTDDPQLFHCQVEFRGTNVLEGFRNAFERGHGKIPVPRHIRDIRRKAQNRYLITEKEPRNR